MFFKYNIYIYNHKFFVCASPEMMILDHQDMSREVKTCWNQQSQTVISPFFGDVFRCQDSQSEDSGPFVGSFMLGHPQRIQQPAERRFGLWSRRGSDPRTTSWEPKINLGILMGILMGNKIIKGNLDGHPNRETTDTLGNSPTTMRCIC